MGTFALVKNFMSKDWVPQHIIVGLFEVSDIFGAAMAGQLQQMLDTFGLTDWILAFMKDEGSRLQTMAGALRSIVSCSPLELTFVFEGTCFGHVMSKACQYATNDAKVCICLREVSVKEAHVVLQIITWTKKYGKCRTEWNKAC